MGNQFGMLKSKSNNNFIKYKYVTLMIAFLGIMIPIKVTSMSTSAVRTIASLSEPKSNIIKMENTDGSTKAFSKAETSEILAYFTHPLDPKNHLQVSEYKNCARVEKSMEEFLEKKLELPIISQSLSLSENPVLSASQKETLKQTPLCEPFFFFFKIIAMQLNGWKLVERASTSE